MNPLETDFWGITNGLFITFVGLMAIGISSFRWKRKDFSLAYFGLFCLIYGIRWLAETATMRTLVGFPFTAPYFDRLLSYLVAIPLAAFLVDIFGPGLYKSMLWAFRTIVAYAVIAICIDLFRQGPLTGPSYNPIVVILWCVIWIINLIFARRKSDIELQVLRVVFSVTLISVGHDQIVGMGLLPWKIHFEHPALLLFCIGLAFVAAHHFFSSERKLLAIEQEIEIARQIQNSNLPADFSCPSGIDIAAKYVPMSTVAGDFYDIHIVDDEGVGILIADVSGHGVGAALIGSMLKIAFASQLKHISDPASVLSEINTILQDKIEYSFVTACSIYIDIANGKLYSSNAGHPAPLLWRASMKQWDQSSVHGMVVGPFANSAYENSAIDILVGDRLILYTDGIIETSNKAGELYGRDRMKSFFEKHPNESAQSVVEKFIDHLSKWSGKSQQTSFDDDLTLLVVDVVPK